MQSTQAFGTVQDSLSFFRNAYDLFASYRASILRLHGLVEANEKTRATAATGNVCPPPTARWN